jgi:hypothetical protein
VRSKKSTRYDAAQQALERRLSRYLGEGLHEDIDLTNFTQEQANFTLTLEIDGDFYGALTTSGFYPFVVAQLWHWTDDKEVVRPYIEPAIAALKWLDEDGDQDEDGFCEYQTRSELGVSNQGWKDSDFPLRPNPWSPPRR